MRILRDRERRQYWEVGRRVDDSTPERNENGKSNAMRERRVRVNGCHEPHRDHLKHPANVQLRAIDLGSLNACASEDEDRAERRRDGEKQDTGAQRRRAFTGLIIGWHEICRYLEQLGIEEVLLKTHR